VNFGSNFWARPMVVLLRTTVERIASFKSNGPNSDKPLIPLTRRARN
jgi:hypothetical protein